MSNNINEDYCYGLDVSNQHDVGITTFKFLDTDKVITLNELELSILANYILDQYKSKDSSGTLEIIEALTGRISSLESNLSTQINRINNPEKLDIDKMLIELGSTVTDESRRKLDMLMPHARASIMDR